MPTSVYIVSHKRILYDARLYLSRINSYGIFLFRNRGCRNIVLFLFLSCISRHIYICIYNVAASRLML